MFGWPVGVTWVGKRLGGARALELPVQYWQRLVNALGQGLNKLTNLQTVKIEGFYQGTDEAAMAHIMSVQWLLANAPNLKLLYACLEKVPWFPPLLHLKHLA